MSPMDGRKPDTAKNENECGLEAVIERQRQKERNLHMIRVSRNTWIAVPKERANRAYAEQYKKDHVAIKPQRVHMDMILNKKD